MAKFKVGPHRNQPTLFPEMIADYIPDGHLAKLVVEIVENLNLKKIMDKYSDIGQQAFSPKILVGILFYGYAIGMRSSRKLAKACVERLDFMYISVKFRPSHKTISEFRRTNLKELQDVFQEIILIGIKLGLVKMGNINVSVDGSKIRANASSKLTKDEEGLKKLLEEVKEKVAGILKEAEETDKKENKEYGNKQGDELPKEIERVNDRKAKIEKAIEELKEEKECLREEIITKNGKITKKEEEEIERKKINLTDKDAKYMKEREGCIKANYNAQLSVDEANQFILANDVTMDCNDKKQLIPMLKQTEENVGTKINEGKADSGYHSGQNLADVSEMEINSYVDDPNKKRIGNENYKYDKVNFKYAPESDSYTCPEGKKLGLQNKKDDKSNYKCSECACCGAKEKCCPKTKNRVITRDKNESFVEANREKITSENGAKKYQKRMYTVEPVYGDIKHNSGFRQFLLRGLEKVQGEFNLMCIVHNLKKIWRYCTANEIDLGLCLTS
ncbi:MAG: IS1182 family transposase [Candidatus Margulisbacteria bacterium]|nr:IS1182 family transposase [Candidatus Margulisiibacteriota bacterium]